jgi:protein SCO1
MKRIRDGLGDLADQVLFVFVTIDPDYETPSMMKERLDYYGGEVVGVTGSIERLAPAYGQWNIIRERKPVPVDEDPTGRGFKYDHTAQMFLVQRGGSLLTTYPYGSEAPEVVEDLRGLLGSAQAPERLPGIGEVRTYRLPPMAYTLDFARNPTVPSYVRLHVGDTMHWINDDYMDHAIGDIYLSPGDRATQRFTTVGDYYFLCTATPGEALRISVRERDAADRPIAD